MHNCFRHFKFGVATQQWNYRYRQISEPFDAISTWVSNWKVQSFFDYDSFTHIS